jgi:2-keto-4-pentenoate hydratase/2-oxohepta-3-ene-1,7-dioic acid hydratase in catechol pathway
LIAPLIVIAEGSIRDTALDMILSVAHLLVYLASTVILRPGTSS